jgi:hypothetical protein
MSGYDDFHSPYQSSQRTHTTVSTLTTLDPGIVDMAGDDEDDLVETEAPLPPLKTVFDCPNIELCIVNGKNVWIHAWCDQSLTPVHATRGLAHLLKKKKCDF